MEHFYQNFDGFMSERNTIFLDIALEKFPSNGVWVEILDSVPKLTLTKDLKFIIIGFRPRRIGLKIYKLFDSHHIKA
jgi:hypothetical protein